MSEQLRKDLQYVLPKLKPDERIDARMVLAALFALLPERKGAYDLREVEAAIKDDYYFQRARVERIANELAPRKSVEFDGTTTWIKFRVTDPVTATLLTEASGEWEPSVLADKSDEWLRDYIKHLSNGKI